MYFFLFFFKALILYRELAFLSFACLSTFSYFLVSLSSKIHFITKAALHQVYNRISIIFVTFSILQIFVRKHMCVYAHIIICFYTYINYYEGLSGTIPYIKAFVRTTLNYICRLFAIGT